MVYRHISRVRVMRERQPGDAFLLTDMADEMLLAITARMPIDDILKLRLTCRNLTPVCNTALQDKLKVLYIHGRDSSLKTALAVCQHPFLGDKIEEVALLVAPTWPESDLDRIRPWDHLVHKSWPSILPGDTVDVSQTGKEKWSLHQFLAVYQPLLAALKGLPKLRSLSFLENVNRPGWNQSSTSAVKAHSEKHSSNRGYRKIKPQHLPTGRRYSDLEVMIGLLVGLGPKWCDLDVSVVLPGLDNRELNRDAVRGAYKLMDALQHLSLSLSRSYGSPEWEYCWPSWLDNAHALRSLHLLLGDEGFAERYPTYHSIPHGTVLNDSLHYKPKFEHLQQLEMTGSSTLSSRRVMLHRFDIIGFLQQHANTLRSIQIHNMVFFYGKGAVATVESILAFASDPKNALVTFDYRFARLSHLNASTPGQCRGRCFCYVYGKDHGGYVTTDDFDDLATRLDIALDLNTEEWSFGEWVLRMREEKQKRIDALIHAHTSL